MRRSKPEPLTREEARRYLNPVTKWRVTTGALLGAVISTGTEILWRGVSVDWDFFHDRMQEIFSLEMLLASIFVGGLCGAMICLIRNQQKGATDPDHSNSLR